MFLTTINMGVHTLLIDDREIQLLELNQNYSKLTETQANTYRLLLALSYLSTDYKVSESVLLTLLGLRSNLPLLSRLKHLEEKGMIRHVEMAIAA